MKDQAEQLRDLVLGLRRENSNNRAKVIKQARIITITSGKGGVGKTSFTINLAICLGQMGYRVVIIDGDFGLANVDLMLGISSRHGLNNIIKGDTSLDDVMVEGPKGVKFISGGSGIKELINLDSRQLEGFLNRIDELNRRADFILIDTGAGATDNIIKMVLAAHEVILIATPEPTAITDAYALTKVISSVRQDIKLQLVINKAENSKEAENILDKFVKTTFRFLGVEIDKLGFILDDRHVSASIKKQEPYVLSYPKSQPSKQVDILAKRLLNQGVEGPTKGQGMASYIRRFLGLWG